MAYTPRISVRAKRRDPKEKMATAASLAATAASLAATASQIITGTLTMAAQMAAALWLRGSVLHQRLHIH
jgi:hypothetical protein